MTEVKPNNLSGIGFILLAGLSITLSALLIRHIGKDLGSFEVILIRCCFTVAFTLMLNARLGSKLFTSPRPMLLGLRSLILPLVMVGNFYAIVHLPLVQVTSLQFTKPLFLVVLAAFFLNERIRLPRTVATLIGFIGILIIMRPGSGFHPAQAAVLIAALGMALMAVVTKKLTKDHLSSTLVLYGNLMAIVVCIGPTLVYWQSPNLFQVGLIAALGLNTYLGQIFMVQAYRYGEATVVTPFEYVRIIFIAAAGFIIFGEIPDQWTIIGAVIICASTLFIALRQIWIKAQSKIGASAR